MIRRIIAAASLAALMVTAAPGFAQASDCIEIFGLKSCS